MIKLYCNKCGKELWPEFMTKFNEFKTHTLDEVEKACVCEECQNNVKK